MAKNQSQQEYIKKYIFGLFFNISALLGEHADKEPLEIKPKSQKSARINKVYIWISFNKYNLIVFTMSYPICNTQNVKTTIITSFKNKKKQEYIIHQYIVFKTSVQLICPHNMLPKQHNQKCVHYYMYNHYSSKVTQNTGLDTKRLCRGRYIYCVGFEQNYLEK